MLQLTAEILRDVLWDGGLKQLSHDMLLLALHETLLRKAVLSYCETTDSTAIMNSTGCYGTPAYAPYYP